MSESFSALGFFVHTPCGPRKSGIPDSVEMPAPVSTTTRSARFTQLRTFSMFTVLPNRSPLWGFIVSQFGVHEIRGYLSALPFVPDSISSKAYRQRNRFGRRSKVLSPPRGCCPSGGIMVPFWFQDNIHADAHTQEHSGGFARHAQRKRREKPQELE